ncbi:hypothetical protein NPIL_125431, partial [Nephila pilipes]
WYRATAAQLVRINCMTDPPLNLHFGTRKYYFTYLTQNLNPSISARLQIFFDIKYHNLLVGNFHLMFSG